MVVVAVILVVVVNESSRRQDQQLNTSNHDLEPSSLAQDSFIMEALPQETATTIDIAAALALRDGDYRGAHQQIDNFLALLVVYSACP